MDNYKETACRMHADSELMYAEKRWFNTCYLSGYVVECYCKLLLKISTNCNVRNFSHNIENMDKCIQNYIVKNGIYSSYCLDIDMQCPNIKKEWDPNFRYESDSFLFNRQDMADKFYKEQKKVMSQITKMIVDGVI